MQVVASVDIVNTILLGINPTSILLSPSVVTSVPEFHSVPFVVEFICLLYKSFKASATLLSFVYFTSEAK